MTGHRAEVRLAGSSRGVAVIPTAGTVRALEKSLLAAGVNATLIRGRSERAAAYVDIADLPLLEQGLDGWDLLFATDAKELITRASDADAALDRARVAITELSRPGAANEALSDFLEREMLDPHQVIAVAAATHPDVKGLCLFDEQGLGKTVEALFAFHRLKAKGSVKSALVFAPKNMLLEWQRDAHRFFGDLYRIVPVAGSEREKRRSLAVPADIYVTNFETAVSLRTRLKHLLQADRGKNLLIVDESFFVKNPGAQRTMAIRGLRTVVERCLVLCGTPAPNSPHDLVEQFNIADGGAAFRGVQVPLEREAALPVVREVIDRRGVYLRRLKQHVLPELPTKTFHRVLLPIEGQQRRAYEAALLGLIGELARVDDITFRKQSATFMAKRVALLQICSNPGAVLDGYAEEPAKLKALDAILEELIARRGEKVVLWSFFTFSLCAILSRYPQFCPARIDGRVSDPIDRREAVRRFQEDDSTMLLIANPAAAGAGLTLHRARFAIYESMSNQAAHYLQSLDRIHRRGQTRPVEYLFLVCDRTLEVVEHDRLLDKERAAGSLLGDELAPVYTRESLLTELISAAQAIGAVHETPPDASVFARGGSAGAAAS